jgi:PAS domain S-box-containing protein
VSEPLRVLILDDVPADAEAVERELARFVSPLPEVRTAGAREDYLDALARFRPHVVLAGTAVPGIEGFDALTLARERDADVPFLYVTDSLSEEIAVDGIKEGADDYVVKGRLARLRSALPAALGRRHDLRERRRTDEERRGLHRAVEQSPVSVVITNRAGDIEYVNPCFTAVTGYSREEALGRNPRILKSGVHPPEFYRQMWDTLLSGRDWSGRIENRRKDGRRYIEDAVISPVADSDGTITHFIAVKQDVTEATRREEDLRRSREELLRTQKSEALGRLAAGVAHDFNNLLTVILGYGQLVATLHEDDEELQDQMKELLGAAERATALTRQLLAFSRRQVLEARPVRLDSIVEELAKMLRRLAGEDVELVLEPSPGLGRAKVDPGQIEQVIVNLAVNAKDAMPGGGRLTIATSNEVLLGDDPRRRGRMPEGPYIRLSVKDTGCGMSEEVAARAFEPFFSARPTGKGTGLGLSTVYGIVKQSGGWVWIDSVVGQGTTVEVWLPRVEARSPSRSGPLEPIACSGGVTVLVVEDDAPLRALARTILEGGGYRVLDAPDGEAALAVADGAHVDLLLTDVVMPRLGGLELALTLQKRRPELRVLFTSGYTPDAEGVSRVLEEGLAFIPKPWVPAALLRKVSEVLERASVR